MAGLKEIAERQQRWSDEKPQMGNFLYLSEGDIAFAHFVSTGQDGDPFWEVFYAHEIPPTQQGGYTKRVYCPVESGFDQNYRCQYCLDGVKAKKRMMMWFWVYSIYHAQLKQGQQFPMVTHGGKPYYREDINDARLWDTSAWKESPLYDILYLGEQLANLNDLVVQVIAVGAGLDRRYKIHTVINSTPIEATVLEEARKRSRPILDVLNEQITPVPTVERQPTPAPATPPFPAPIQTPTPAQEVTQNPVSGPSVLPPDAPPFPTAVNPPTPAPAAPPVEPPTSGDTPPWAGTEPRKLF